MNPQRSPAAMDKEERFEELAELLATGYIRLLAKRRISSAALALHSHGEAPCSLVNAKEKEGQ